MLKAGEGLKHPITLGLSGERKGLRIGLAVFFALLAVFSLGFGLRGCLSHEAGWQEIEPASGDTGLTLLYEVPEKNATAFYKTLSALYSQAALRAQQLLDPRGTYEELGNLALLNRHPNERVTLEPELWEALSLFTESGDRSLFLSPLYAEHGALCWSSSDFEAAQYDPRRSDEAAAFTREVLSFALDPSAVSLELGEGNSALLRVSSEYASFAGENGIDALLDFGWMKSAFLADMTADVLLRSGYTNGLLRSGDGFVRCLDGSGREYAISAGDRLTDARGAESLELRTAGPVAAAVFHSGPIPGEGRGAYYVYEDGTCRAPYLSPADGLSHAAAPALIVFSPSASCGELVLAAHSIYSADALDEAALKTLAAENVYAAWLQNGAMIRTDRPSP